MDTVVKPDRCTLSDWTAAFADGAVLFPLMAALVSKTGMDSSLVLAFAGLAYIAAGLVFRVPMAVQPLKSVVVAALAIGAGAAEIAWAGFAVGVACLILSFCNADRFAALVPRHIVHGLQMALGILLITKGVEGGIGGAPLTSLLFVAATAGIIWVSFRTDRPVLGWVATAGLVIGLFLAFKGGRQVIPAASRTDVDFHVVLSLFLPQLALTLANSVVGTHDVCRRYFGDAAARVTPKWLLRSIGLGNILVAPLGGMPFCHGAGGVTAHWKGGAKSWHMNIISGGALLALAGASALLAIPLLPSYPQVLLSALLIATGWFHLQLAAPSWQDRDLRGVLAVMALVALASQDMLWVLGAGVVAEIGRRGIIALRMKPL